MKVLVDCDEVFERLTRGPFPSGEAGDDDVELHLHACHECRELAEAFRPAVNLLHEAYRDEASQVLPVYRAEPVAKPSTRRAMGWHSWQVVAALLVGLMIGFFALGQSSRESKQPTTTSLPGQVNLTLLAGLRLNNVCAPLSRSASTTDLHCCTNCHSATAAMARPVDVSRLQLACVACHERQ